jgi:hypothetical protein
LPGETHTGDHAVDNPFLVGIGINDRRTLAAEFEPSNTASTNAIPRRGVAGAGSSCRATL